MSAECELVSALKAVQNVYACKTDDTLIKFTPKLVFSSYQTEKLENALYSYITNKHNLKLDDKQTRLLFPKIEAYLLNLLDPKDEMHALIDEARDALLVQQTKKANIKPKLG